MPGSPPPDEIKGQGASLWDVGFRSDGRAVRFARTRPATPGQAAEYEYFDLRGRFFFNPEPNELPYRHAIAAEAGWTIRPVDQYQFDFRNNQNQGWRQVARPDQRASMVVLYRDPPGTRPSTARRRRGGRRRVSSSGTS